MNWEVDIFVNFTEPELLDGNFTEPELLDDFELLPTKACTRAQLGLPKNEDDTDSDYSQNPIFYDLHQNGMGDVEFYHKKLKCLESGFIRI